MKAVTKRHIGVLPYSIQYQEGKRQVPGALCLGIDEENAKSLVPSKSQANDKTCIFVIILVFIFVNLLVIVLGA